MILGFFVVLFLSLFENWIFQCAQKHVFYLVAKILEGLLKNYFFVSTVCQIFSLRHLDVAKERSPAQFRVFAVFCLYVMGCLVSLCIPIIWSQRCWTEINFVFLFCSLLTAPWRESLKFLDKKLHKNCLSLYLLYQWVII